MGGVTVCYKCPDRQLGCHDKCERYLAAKAKWDDDKKAIAASMPHTLGKNEFNLYGNVTFKKFRKKYGNQC